MVFEVNALSDYPEVAGSIIEASGESRHLAFYGEMGVGKTTLILEILKVLGVKDRGSSPTFSIVNEYERPDGDPVYHFDFYRIESEEEVYDIGYETYFYSGFYCLMEWPEKIQGLLPDDVVEVSIEKREETRIIALQ
ncbi:MAG: tRNA (adenosine(37)-N6)-threonylcarbamoyltransferase complex ATPase subunit type 1 TsaE [Flavobacteriales bacterium]|nr:tRNA (adenosine(37)-N6)-threonylcarbamoyltransferase complex ATPase subunit type 1 TsaE [Flavobacteriales bacterium]